MSRTHFVQLPDAISSLPQTLTRLFTGTEDTPSDGVVQTIDSPTIYRGKMVPLHPGDFCLFDGDIIKSGNLGSPSALGWIEVVRRG